MRRISTRVIAVLLCLTVLLSAPLYFAATKAAEPESPNIAMVEAILRGNRQFVRESLLFDDFSNNPHALANGIGGDKSMMANALSQYRNENDENYSAAYKTAVDVMEKVYNKDDYLSAAADYITEFGASLLDFFGLDATGLINDLTQSVGEIKYESILKDTLDEDYVSSSGCRLSSKESELINLRRLEKGAKGLSDFTSVIKSLAENDSGEAFDGDIAEYYNDFLLPYGDAVYDVLDNFSDEQKTQSQEARMLLIKALAMVQQGDRFESSSNSVGEKVVTYCPTYFLDDATLELIDFFNSGIKNTSTAISSYMFIRSIQEQKDSVAGPLKRMAETATEDSLRVVCNDFAKEITAAADSKTVDYESVMHYIRESGIVTDFIKDRLSDGLESAANLVNLGTEYTALSSAFSKASAVVGISSWCADELMGFEATCKKTYELKYLDKMIKEAVFVCSSDILAYESSKTDENAAKILDDLMLIQKMRLRGETITYSMMHEQFDSPLAKLLANGTLKNDEMLDDYLDTVYQYHVDALIGASVMPYSTDGFTIGSGETLTLLYDESLGGSYAYYTTADKKIYSIAEPQYRFANGITVSSGGKFVGASNANYIPFVVNNGGTVLIGSNMQTLSELTQTSGTTTFGEGDFNISDVALGGGVVNSGSSASLYCDFLETSGEPAADGVTFTAGSAELNGAPSNFTLYLNGDLSGGGSIGNLIISGTGWQTLDGSVDAANLTYQNTGVAMMTGTINVSGTVKNASSKVVNGQNTILKPGGAISGNYYNSSITLDGATLNHSVKFGENLYTQDTTSISGAEINKLLNQNGTLNISGNVSANIAYLNGSVNQTVGDFSVTGDIGGGNNSINLGNLILNGKAEQTINSEMTVKGFVNNNPSKAGIVIMKPVYITGPARSNGNISDGNYLIMTDTASFAENSFKGNITIRGLSGSLPENVNGTVYLQADVTQNTSLNCDVIESTSGTLTINNTRAVIGTCNLNGGNINLNNAELNIDRILNNQSSNSNINIGMNGSLTAKSDVLIKGSISGEGELCLRGDLINDGGINIDNLSVMPKSPIVISGNDISVKNLDINADNQVTLEAKINVSGRYTSKGKIVNPSNVVFFGGKEPSESVTYNDMLHINGDFIVDGKEIIAKGGLTVENGDIIIKNGGRVSVNGKTTLSGGSGNTINIDEASEFNLNKLSEISGFTNIIVDGALIFGGDVKITSTSISGGGTINVNCDIYGDDINVDKPGRVNITGKTPQVISLYNAEFKNLYVANTSKQGVEFENEAYYCGEYKTNGCPVKGKITKREDGI